VRVKFIERELRGDATVASALVERIALLKDAMAVGTQALRVYSQKGWSDRDRSAIEVGLLRAGAILDGSDNGRIV
jgi:hypothetical protein